MGMSARTAGNFSEKRNDLDLAGLSAWLRRRHPVKTAAAVAAETGLPEERVRKWLAGSAAPTGGSLVALLAAYGPAVLAAALTHVPAWLDESVRAEALAELERERARLAAEMEKLKP